MVFMLFWPFLAPSPFSLQNDVTFTSCNLLMPRILVTFWLETISHDHALVVISKNMHAVIFRRPFRNNGII